MSKVLLRLLEDEETADRAAPPDFQVLVGSFIKKTPPLWRGRAYRETLFCFWATGCSPVGRGPCRFVGADSISARGCLRQRRAGGMRASRPTDVRVVAASRLVAGPPLVVGEGFIPPADTCGSARSPGRCKHRPLQRFAIPQRVRFPGWPRTLPFRRGGFHIRPRVFAPPRFPGWSLCFPPSCRAGVHARRTLAYFKNRDLAARRARRDEASRPTAVRVVAASGWPHPLLGEGFIPPRAKLWWASQGPRHPRPKKQSPDCFLRLAPPGFQVLAGPFIKKCPRLSGGKIVVGQPGLEPGTKRL